jgi:hypothetical protein
MRVDVAKASAENSNAAQDSAVAAVTQTPSRPRTRVTLSAAMPVKKSQTVKTA